MRVTAGARGWLVRFLAQLKQLPPQPATSANMACSNFQRLSMEGDSSVIGYAIQSPGYARTRLHRRNRAGMLLRPLHCLQILLPLMISRVVKPFQARCRNAKAARLLGVAFAGCAPDQLQDDCPSRSLEPEDIQGSVKQTHRRISSNEA